MGQAEKQGKASAGSDLLEEIIERGFHFGRIYALPRRVADVQDDVRYSPSPPSELDSDGKGYKVQRKSVQQAARSYAVGSRPVEAIHPW